MTGRPRPAGGVEGSTAQEPQRGAPEPLRFFTPRTAWFAILGAAAIARLLFVALSPNVWQFLDSREVGLARYSGSKIGQRKLFLEVRR